MPSLPPAPPRRFLFLQGPISPFFREVAAGLRALGHATRRINLSLGDRLFWDGSFATDYTGTPADWPGFVAHYLEREAITDLLLLGEQRPYHRAAIAAARSRGIAVTVTDYGYLRPDWIVLERDGMGAESRFPRDPAAIRALAEGLPVPDLRPRYAADFARQARWDMAAHLAALLPFPFRHYESYLLHHPVPAYLGTGLRLLRRRRDTAEAARRLAALAGQRPLFLFAMQMENDFSIRAYSAFPDNDAALRAALQSFARGAPPGAQFLAKVHPLDPGLKRWGARLARLAAEAGVAGRAHLLDGALPAEAAILASHGVVTINSTLAVEAIALGRPVLALGRAIYQVPGLAWQGPPDRFWQDAPPPDAALADAFLRGIAACLHVRGRFYGRPGLDVAVAGAVRRLHMGLVNAPLPAVTA
ncbi:capsular polysaccharide export protein, LipB/KpsS family [Paracraurococcus ruber]|uniref:Capsular biosynthesis protein n=1 Tax=Paracraurococcus ruber TaxID=77675 RepID=A0ABS1D6F0_9PROT|nr:capsular biosynthesis protein [Paracraurococcus ruber]MBK1662394.1 capsular biosynthesis protein [Paracraurococcus ruber]TDG12337.1 capsular biosynthesis protein [Paracraurococcus ruber]